MSDKDRILVDFDHTITSGEGPPFWSEDNYEEPNQEMIDWINEKYNEGHFIIVWTARPWTQAGEVASYLTKWGVKYYGIRCCKGGAEMYIDDKAHKPEDVLDEN